MSDIRKDIRSGLEVNKTLSDRISLFITNVFGSMPFLCFCLVFFLGWMVWNLGLLPGLKAFDRFPFLTLEMVVSIFAVILSVSVLISQNRQRRIEKIRQQVEFEVNLRAEEEITKVLSMLHEIQKKLGIDANDSELEKMKEDIDLEKIQRQMNDISGDRKD